MTSLPRRKGGSTIFAKKKKGGKRGVCFRKGGGVKLLVEPFLEKGEKKFCGLQRKKRHVGQVPEGKKRAFATDKEKGAVPRLFFQRREEASLRAGRKAGLIFKRKGAAGREKRKEVPLGRDELLSVCFQKGGESDQFGKKDDLILVEKGKKELHSSC